MSKRFHIPREELRQLYYVKGWTQRQIAAHYGCTDSVVVQRMKTYGFQARDRGDYYQINLSCAELEELYVEQGLSTAQIAARQGCSHTTVWKLLQRCGIPLRFPGGQFAIRLSPEVLAAWPTPALAYAVGLFAADGHLGKGNHLIGFTSTDEEQIENYCTCLKLDPTITARVYPPDQENHKSSYRLNFSDRAFYAFLQELGLTPANNPTVGPLAIPNSVFADFARGCWDGDGGFSIHRRRGRKDQLRSYLTSSSPGFLKWMQKCIETLSGLHGSIYDTNLAYYGPKAIALGRWLYYAPSLPALTRKRVIWEQFAT
jgi:hypothetical protein